MMRGIGLVAVMVLMSNVQAAPPLRVMSYNIRYATAPDGDNHWEKRKEFLTDTIRSFDPDLLGTQETLAIQRDYLLAQLKGYEVVAAGRDDGKDQGEMAALFFKSSRFEKVSSGHFWLSETPEQVGLKGWDATLPRIASWVKLNDRLTPKQKPVLFVNTHLDHQGSKARLNSCKLIRKKLAELGEGCRVIITGDFNADAKSEPYAALFDPIDTVASPVVDTLRVVRPVPDKNEGTFSAFREQNRSGARIDWIAASRDWDVRQAHIDNTARDGRTPSDHFAVTAVLRIAEDSPTIRVLCYNIHHGEGTDGKIDLPRLANVIRQADPDLVALQEVDKNTKRTNKVDQTAVLAKLTGLEGAFGKQIDYQGGEYGQAILSRAPMWQRSIFLLPGEPEREQRIAYAVRVSLQGQDLAFATTHLHHQNDEFRQRQAKALTNFFNNSSWPVILAGDFNAYPASKPMQILAENWVNASKEESPTFPAGKPTRQIDYVLHRPAERFQVVSTQVLDEPVASDHRPFLAVLKIVK